MEICFVPDNDYGRFLEGSGMVARHEGEIVDREGRVLGRHHGVEFFTVGQRRGLGIAAGRPLYVIALDAARNRVVVGEESELMRDRWRVASTSWVDGVGPQEETRCIAQVRHGHAGVDAVVRPLPGGIAEVSAAEPVRAVTPGQACVFYEGDRVLGGGWIMAT